LSLSLEERETENGSLKKEREREKANFHFLQRESTTSDEKAYYLISASTNSILSTHGLI